MIYLRTGANGSCKTLFTLADVRKLQLDTGRPVCINQRFKMNEAKRLEFGWKVIDFKDWQAEPDETIFFIDECHNDLPIRANGSPVPEPVRMLAEHRARGFDFFLLTQHPMNIDAFVRKLIGAPGYHQHLKRVFGGTNVTRVLQWDAVNASCEKDGSGKSAQIVTRKQPSEVFEWYDSASLHTAKVRIPKQLFLFVGGLFLVAVLGYFAYRNIEARTHQKGPVSASSAVVSPDVVTGQAYGGRVLSPDEYVQSYQPRVGGLAYTAPRYDDQTKPTTAPYPAACVAMGSKCKCYTQQATTLDVPDAMCREIVKGGYFIDWQPQQLARTEAPQVAQH